MNWVTIALVVAFALVILAGYGEGLVAKVFGFIGFVLSLLAAGRYAPAARQWLQKSWHLTDVVAKALHDRINLPAGAESIPASTLTFDRAMQLLHSLPAPPAYKVSLAHQLTDNALANVSLGQYLLQKLAEGMIEAACFVVIAGVVGYAVYFLTRRIAARMHQAPFFGFFDKILGALIGAVEATVMLSVLLGVLSPFLSMASMGKLGEAVAASSLAQWLISLYPTVSQLVFGKL